MTTATAERQNHHNHGRLPPPPGAPRLTIGQAVRRHWLLATLPPLLLVGVAVAISFQRSPTYTAQARLNAGPVGASPQTFSGVAEASQALAGTYARVINAQAVIEPIGAELGVNPAQVASRIEASPIPDSSLILLDARGPSERSAVELANLAGASLIRYVTTLTERNEDSAGLLKEFTRTSIAHQELVARRRYLESGVTPANRAQLQRIEAEIEAGRLELRTLSSLYQTSQQGKASANSIQVLSPAVLAQSDRISVLQRLVFVALLAGVAAGVALAVMRSRRRPRLATEHDRSGEIAPPEGDLAHAAQPSTGEPGSVGASAKAGRKGRSRRILVYAALLALIGGAAVTGAYLAFGVPNLLASFDARSSREPRAPLHDPPVVTPEKTRSEPREAELRLIPTAAVRVCLVDAGNRRLLAGKVLQPGGSPQVYRSERFRISLGTPDVQLHLNGRRLAVPKLPGPVGYEVTAARRKRLPPPQQPTCGEGAQSAPSGVSG